MVLYLHSLKVCLFADDTTIYSSNNDLNQLLSRFESQLEPFLNWVKFNQLTINWKKTKIMFLTKKSDFELPSEIQIDGNLVEVVRTFKLLGVIIDDHLKFNEHIENMKKIVNRKLYSIKRIFYLANNVKLQFFKSFILPHFDYCLSLFIYFNKTLIANLEKFFNTCIYRLFNLELFKLNLNQQLELLEEYKLFPLKIRIFYRINIFCYKILNKQILPDFFNKLIFQEAAHVRKCKKIKIVKDPFEKGESSKFTDMRLSVFLPKFINAIVKYSFNLNFIDFSSSLKNNLVVLYNIFVTEIDFYF